MAADTDAAPGAGATAPPARPPGRRRSWVSWAVGALAVYLVTAYVGLPAFWRHYEHLPAMASMPKVTRTPSGLPGDPLNVALVGAEAEVQRALGAAGWRPADPITLESSLGIAESVVLDRPDPDAPVSTLVLFGRRQDLAWEREVGASARQRHHVRLWRSDRMDDGRPVWVGAVTFDRGVGLSHTTGQITHHIAPDVDAERDGLMRALADAHQLTALYEVTGVGPTLNGRNGGGDRYFTDGELAVGVLAVTPGTAPVAVLASPVAVIVKKQLWTWLGPVLAGDRGPAPPAATTAE